MYIHIILIYLLNEIRPLQFNLNGVRRDASMSLKGMHFIGMGVSGGEEGARNGPSLMVGGKHEQYLQLEPIFSKCSAQV